MTQTIQIKARAGEPPAILNPIKRGAVVDWKATAAQLAEQLMEAHQVLRASSHNSQTLSDLLSQSRADHGLLRARHHLAMYSLGHASRHWAFRLLPHPLKLALREALAHAED